MKKMTAVLILLSFLAGCSGAAGEMDRGLALRGKILKAEACSFDAVVTADYGDKLHQFRLNCQVDKQGNLGFTVSEPETISGVSGIISDTGGKLTFDEHALYLPLLTDEQITPVSAPWIFMKTLRGGCITSVGMEENTLRLSIDDSYEEDALRLDIWLDSQELPKNADILYDGRRILSLDIENFTIL